MRGSAFLLVSMSFCATSLEAELIAISPTVVTYGNPDDPLYVTPRGVGYDGVALLTIESPEGSRGCTGALLQGGRQLLTAAHCLTDAAGNVNVWSLSATFYPGGSTAPEVIAGSYFRPYPGFDGRLQRGDDIAIVGLERPAPAGVQRYRLYGGSGEVGSIYEVVGFGSRGSGNEGAVIQAEGRRRGWNTFDATMASTFGAFAGWTGGERVLVSDFDNGRTGNDALGRFYGIPGLGLGTREAGIAPGDSGAPAFIDGRIAGIASFRVRLNFTDGASSDVDDILNGSFGEFNAFTRVSEYDSWLQPVPEPPSAALCMACVCAVGFLCRQRGTSSRL